VAAGQVDWFGRIALYLLSYYLKIAYGETRLGVYHYRKKMFLRSL